MRTDGRKNTESRIMGANLGLLNRCDGSGKFQFGDKNVVLCGVVGPAPIKLRDELIDKAFVSVTFTRLSGAGDTQDRLYERILGHIANAFILTSLYPRTLIQITFQVISEDGSLLTTAINAMILALLDAGVPLSSTCSATSCVVDKKGNLLLDPTSQEIENCASVHYFAFDSLSEKCVQIQSNGTFTDDEFSACYDVSFLACKNIYSFLKDSFSKKIAFEKGVQNS